MNARASRLRHLVAVGVTILWIRFALAPVLTQVTASISGGACFVGTAVTFSTERTLDDAYFAWGHQALGLSFAAFGAFLVGLAAAGFFALIRGGYIRKWLPFALGFFVVVIGAMPSVLCRFPAVMFPPESVVGAWLLVSLAVGLTFLVYWLAFVIDVRQHLPRSRSRGLEGA